MDGSPPAGSIGQSPSGVWGLGAKPQKPETNANFQLRRGACTHVPLGYATDTVRLCRATSSQKTHVDRWRYGGSPEPVG